MSSAAKAFANRANATHSTGPIDTGKTRFNGLAHGLTSKQTVIPGENQAEYDTFAVALRKDLRPCSAIEKLLADRIIAAAWRLKRFTRVEAAFFTARIDAHLTDNPDSDPDTALANLFSDPAEMARMRLFLRYQTAVQNEYDKAVREFKKVQADNRKHSLEQAYVDKLGFTSDTESVSGDDAELSATPSNQAPHQDHAPLRQPAAQAAVSNR